MFKIALHFILSLASLVAASYCQFKYFNCLVTSPVHVFVGQPACLLKDCFSNAVSEIIPTPPPPPPPSLPCTTPTFYGLHFYMENTYFDEWKYRNRNMINFGTWSIGH